MATCEERFEIYEAKRFGKVTWEAFTDMNEKQMVEVIQHLSEEQRECYLAAIAKQEEERKLRWAAKSKAEKELFDLVEKNAEEELFDLVRKNELTRETLATYMEETEVDLNNQDEHGRTMLMRATGKNAVGVMRILIEANVDVDMHDKNGNTALYCAAVKGHNDCVALLIDAQADLELRNRNGRTLLRNSLFFHQSSAAPVSLLDAKADAWAEDNRGYIPVSRALWAHIHNHEIMYRILQQSPNEHGVTALMVAACRGYVNPIPKLLEMGEDPELEDKNGMTALMMAMMPREGEQDWQIGGKLRIVNLLRGDRTNAELNEMRRVLYLPKEVPPRLILPEYP